MTSAISDFINVLFFGMLDNLPVIKLSIIVTLCASSQQTSKQSELPIYPAPPVIKTFIIYYFLFKPL